MAEKRVAARACQCCGLHRPDDGQVHTEVQFAYECSTCEELWEDWEDARHCCDDESSTTTTEEEKADG